MSTLRDIADAVRNGRAKTVKQLVPEALNEGIPASEILSNGLLIGMQEIGELFKKEEVYVPEVLITARAMNTGVELLKPYLTEENAQPKGRMIIGTAEGDLHDIGKNLVRMMFEGRGFEVIDLGVNVPPAKFVEAITELKPQIVGISSLLTTSMPAMAATVEAIKAAGLRDTVKIMVGGAPVTEEFAAEIGADKYTADAATAADWAAKLLG